MQAEHHSHSKHRMSPSTKLALFVFIGVAGFYLWTEHQAHLFDYGPYLILLLCPLMHIFMHGGHGGHGGHEEDEGHSHATGEEGQHRDDHGHTEHDHPHETTAHQGKQGRKISRFRETL